MTAGCRMWTSRGATTPAQSDLYLLFTWVHSDSRLRDSKKSKSGRQDPTARPRKSQDAPCSRRNLCHKRIEYAKHSYVASPLLT